MNPWMQRAWLLFLFLSAAASAANVTMYAEPIRALGPQRAQFTLHLFNENDDPRGFLTFQQDPQLLRVVLPAVECVSDGTSCVATVENPGHTDLNVTLDLLAPFEVATFRVTYRVPTANASAAVEITLGNPRDSFRSEDAKLGLEPNGFSVDGDTVEFTFDLKNTYLGPQDRNAWLVFDLNPQRLQLVSPGANCTADQAQCVLPVYVSGTATAKARLKLLEYFDRESFNVRLYLPSRNASSPVANLPMANQPDPGSLRVELLSWVGFAFLLLAAGAWAFSVLRGDSKPLADYRLPLSGLANLTLALGATLVLFKTPDLASAATFVAVFSVGFLLLEYLHQSKPKPEAVLSAEDLARKRAMIKEQLNVAKMRFMRREIDERTFARLTGDLELEQVKLEAAEHSLNPPAKPAA